ncbi:MAG: glycosyl hydrolase family 28 protein [Bacteroidaceae bacterium]|nr:glycosyl hydrolase family 28 protein [Bacteroidaceae bacterium]
MKYLLPLILQFLILSSHLSAKELWPDGTAMDKWFQDTTKIDMQKLGKQYVVTEHGVLNDSTILQTAAIQAVIDKASAEGGGVIVIPRGTFLSAALFFKPGTHLCVQQGAKLKAIDDIRHYPVLKTRIEGQTRQYFSAFINADGLDGFTIGGGGTIDGCGLRFWEEFWVRRVFNPECTNVDAMRYRLVYISDSKNVTVQDVRLINSPFWTNHIYRSHHVRYLSCYIYSPTSGIGAYGDTSHGGPSTDAIDLDVCHDVLVNDCYMSVNDDAVVLKGGKGTWADQMPENGPNYNILVQNCRYGVVHGCLTIGSESLHSYNVVLRNITFDKAHRVLWLKMRPDTPQHYEYIRLENLQGNCGSFLVVKPWTQFYKLDDRPDMPVSVANDVTIQNVNVECTNFFNVSLSEKYILRNFSFLNSTVKDKQKAFDAALITNTKVSNLRIE